MHTRGFTKLFSSLVTSSIWSQADPVRIVWVTLLALADKNGEVWAAIPGLADVARVSLDACEEAIRLLSGPDPYSRTQLFEGRRIEVIPGGWRLLNYQAYRELGRDEDRREYLKLKQREHRAKIRSESTNVNTGQQPSTQDAVCQPLPLLSPPTPPSCIPLPEANNTPKPPRGVLQADDPGFMAFWNAYPKKVGKGAALIEWRKLKAADREAALAKVPSFAAAWAGAGDDRRQYLVDPERWLKRRRWEDDPKEWKRQATGGNGEDGGLYAANPLPKKPPSEAERELWRKADEEIAALKKRREEATK